MTINTEINANKAKLTVDGRLDTITSPVLDAAINKLPDEITELVLNMEKLEYISSAGLRVILKLFKTTLKFLIKHDCS